MQSKDNRESRIEQVGKNNPFSIPENYFESFPEKLRKRLQAKQPPRVSVRDQFWQILRPQLALAAAIIGFALLGYFGFQTFIRTEEELLSNDVIAEYINYNQHEFSEYYLISIMDENDIYPEDAFYLEDEPYLSSPDEYMDYLYMDEIDINLIITEF